MKHLMTVHEAKQRIAQRIIDEEAAELERRKDVFEVRMQEAHRLISEYIRNPETEIYMKFYVRDVAERVKAEFEKANWKITCWRELLLLDKVTIITQLGVSM